MKRNILGKLIIAQPVNTTLASFETRRFITELTTAHHSQINPFHILTLHSF
jgi:hypothetical protein